jgi:hypothetical protein
MRKYKSLDIAQLFKHSRFLVFKLTEFNKKFLYDNYAIFFLNKVTAVGYAVCEIRYGEDEKVSGERH